MGQKQLPDINVKRAAERHTGRSHAERGNEDIRAWRQIGELIPACSEVRRGAALRAFLRRAWERGYSGLASNRGVNPGLFRSAPRSGTAGVRTQSVGARIFGLGVKSGSSSGPVPGRGLACSALSAAVHSNGLAPCGATIVHLLEGSIPMKPRIAHYALRAAVVLLGCSAVAHEHTHRRVSARSARSFRSIPSTITPRAWSRSRMAACWRPGMPAAASGSRTTW